MKSLAALLCLILIHPYSHSQQLDSHDEQALRDTQRFLTTPKERREFVEKDPKAKEVDDKVNALAGSAKNKEEIYGIASEIMEKIVQATNGDPKKMDQLLMEAQKDPQAFYNKYFDENAKARVRGVAADIQKSGRVNAPK